MRIEINFTLPSPIQKPGKLLVDELYKQFAREKYIMRKLYEQTTETWENEKPTFDVKSYISSGDLIIDGGISSSSDPVGALKWDKLDEGFERHHWMNDGYVRKTFPGVLRSRPGLNTGIGSPTVIPIDVLPRRWSDIILFGMLTGNFKNDPSNPGSIIRGDIPGAGKGFSQRIENTINRVLKKSGLLP